MQVFTKDAKALAMFVVAVLIGAFAVASVMLLARLWCETWPAPPPAYPGGILK